MKGNTISILEGSTFVVSDNRGDITEDAAATAGLFHGDTRFLSRWIMTIDGIRPQVLSTDDLQYSSAQFFLVLSTGTIYSDSKVSVTRKRVVGNGFHEELTVHNHGPEAIQCSVNIEAGADFADLFEVKDALAKKGQHYKRSDGGVLVLGYRREGFVRETWISTSQPATVTEEGLRFEVSIPGHTDWTVNLEVAVGRGGPEQALQLPKYHSSDEAPRPNIGMSLDEWVDTAPQLNCSNPVIKRTYDRSIIDLAALRFYPLLTPGESVPSAGLPWFMALFGRDSLIVSYQAMPFQSNLAKASLKVLAARQGTTMDPFRDEEPGKILHEARAGELTAFEERPHSPYFGSADSTPLWLIVLDEYERWTGDRKLVQELKPNALAALRWIDEYGDRDGDGYVEYERRIAETGLDNQCWKDSGDSIAFGDGRIAQLPRATCEIQGYVYDAKRRAARLARDVWSDPQLADRLDREAFDLKQRFNRDFWIEDPGFYALALDGHKQKVDSLTSNIGHLMWSGIVDENRAEICARQLMGPRLYSGWGVRTMATGEGSYNPIGYHVGTVWPHDNSLIAMGLRRYGYKEEASRLALSIFEAAGYFDNRLPEAFAGYERSDTRFPVEYPTACSPQAWATGAPLLLLRVLLGLEPIGEDLLVAPMLPTDIERLEILGIPGRWGAADAFGRGTLQLDRAGVLA